MLELLAPHAATCPELFTRFERQRADETLRNGEPDAYEGGRVQVTIKVTAPRFVTGRVLRHTLDLSPANVG